MDFIKGMDVSSYQETIDLEYEYFNACGEKIDILAYAVEMGFNYGRIRIWNEPHNTPEAGGYCSLSETIKLAQKMKELGIPYLLDFHYSDWWADPGHQKKPKNWENLHGTELEKAVFDFTYETLECLIEKNIAPDMVQVGNEIRCGMLWPDGNVEHFDGLAGLINAGIQGVRACSKGSEIKIMLHLDQGGRYHYFKEWFDAMLERGVTDFDVIGLSYYPFWHGSYQDLDETLNKLVDRYGKDLIVVETAYSYRLADDSLFGKGQERLGAYPASEEGQCQALQLIEGIIEGVKDKRGKGFFYWEPFSRSKDPKNWGYCMGITDETGRPLKAFLTLKDSRISVEKAREIYQNLHYGDDSLEHIKGEKLLANNGFWKDMKFVKPDNVKVSFEEDDEEQIFSFQSKGNVKFELSKSLCLTKMGNYCLAVEYKGDNTTGVCIRPFVKMPDAYRETSIYPSEERWTCGIIEFEIKEKQEIVIGINVDSPQIKGKIRKIGLYLR